MKSKLSVLWTVVMFNMLFADVFSIMVELVNGGTLAIPGDVKTVMAVAAVVTNIPILMIYFSRFLPYKSNRIANIGSAVFTILYVIGGGSSLPHYFIIGGIEVVILCLIIWLSWNWKASND